MSMGFVSYNTANVLYLAEHNEKQKTVITFDTLGIYIFLYNIS